MLVGGPQFGDPQPTPLNAFKVATPSLHQSCQAPVRRMRRKTDREHDMVPALLAELIKGRGSGNRDLEPCPIGKTGWLKK